MWYQWVFKLFNCKHRKKLVDPLIETCTENINETKPAEKTLDKNENKDKCNFYVVYKALFWTFLIFFIINLGIDIYFIYYNWSLINNNNNNIYCIKFNNRKKKQEFDECNYIKWEQRSK